MSDQSPTKRKVDQLINFDRKTCKLSKSRSSENVFFPIFVPTLLALEDAPRPLSPILGLQPDDDDDTAAPQNDNDNSVVVVQDTTVSTTTSATFTKKNTVKRLSDGKRKRTHPLVTYRRGQVMRSFDRAMNAGIKCALFDRGECNFSCLHPSSMKTHALTHIDEQAFACELCPQKYKQREHLTRHRKVHDADDPTGGKRSSKDRENPLRLKCTKWDEGCSWSFHSPNTKRSHECVHSDEYLYECGECDSKFKRQSNVQEHHDRKHRTLARVSCPLCDRSLAPYCLYEHLKRHEKCDSFNCKSYDFGTHEKQEWLDHLVSDDYRQKYTPSKIKPSSIINKEDYKTEVELEFSPDPIFVKCKNADTCPVCRRVMVNVSKISYGGYFFEITPGMTCQSMKILYMWVNKRTGRPIYKKHRYVGITETTLYKRISQYNPNMENAGRLIKELFTKYGNDLGLIPVLMVDDADPPNILSDAEKNFISCFNCMKNVDGGCNLQPGGKGIENMPLWLVNWLRARGHM